MFLNPKPSCRASVSPQEHSLLTACGLQVHGTLWALAAWALGSFDTAFHCVFPSPPLPMISRFLNFILRSLGHSYDLFYLHILNQEMIIRKMRSEQQEGESSIWVVAPTGCHRNELCCPLNQYIHAPSHPTPTAP